MGKTIKKCEIDEATFKELMDGVKRCISTDGTRPMLEYIQVAIRKDKAVFWALDGYCAGRVETIGFSSEDEFDCYIKPFPFKSTAQGINPVKIEFDGEYTSVEVATAYGKLKYKFEIPKDRRCINIEEIYNNARKHDRELGINAALLIRACTALKGYGGRNHEIVIQTKNSQVEPIIVSAAGHLTKNEQLILPLRMSAGDFIKSAGDTVENIKKDTANRIYALFVERLRANSGVLHYEDISTILRKCGAEVE